MIPRLSGARRRAGLVLVLLVLAVTVLAVGCLDRNLKPLQPCTVSGVVKNVNVENVDKVDLLFMVDDSNSMKEEQANLRVQFPRLVTTLASGQITDPTTGMVTRMFTPVKSLHVGVVDSDMGSGGFTVPTCGNGDMGYMFGDDGILRTRGDTSITGCMASYPKFLTFTAGTDNPMTLAQDFSCVSEVGTEGCGFEQQLESPLKALTPSNSSITFSMGTVGHGDTDNAGFLRDNSLLTIIVVTDEDECTPNDLELFNPDPANPTYPGDLNLRCFMYPMAVQPPSRYISGFLALRQNNPGLLIFAAITGVPPDLVSDPNNIDFNAILADPRMQNMPDPMNPTQLTPSCNRPNTGLAFPPVNIVKVAQGIAAAAPATGIVQSICADDFTPALDAIISKIADALKGACLPRALNPASDGSVKCDVVEVLPALDSGADVTHCSQLADKGRDPTPIRMETDSAGTHEVCRVHQIIPFERGGTCDPTGTVAGKPPCDPGWYYDDSAIQGSDVMTKCGPPANPTAQRISYTMGDEPATGTHVRLECLQPVSAGSSAMGSEVVLGTPCGGSTMTDCSSSSQIHGLTCDTTSNTCQLQCTTDADCKNANLGGFVCDGICKNPTCGN